MLHVLVSFLALTLKQILSLPLLLFTLFTTYPCCLPSNCMFFVKKPFNLDFNNDNSTTPKKLTVTSRKGKSNTKLVVYEDGSIYLKNGSQYFKMTQKEMKKSTKVCKEVDNGLVVVEDLDKKSFIHKE